MDFFYERLPCVNVLQLYAPVEQKYIWLWSWLIKLRNLIQSSDSVTEFEPEMEEYSLKASFDSAEDYI